MKILWLINLPTPEASILLGNSPSPYGGWLITASQFLSEQKGIELSIAFPDSDIKQFTRFNGKRITYYAFKAQNDRNADNARKNKKTDGVMILQDIIREVKPDLIHIYGTELAHTLLMVNAGTEENIPLIISIQGLVSIIKDHVRANLPINVVYGFTIRNLVRRDNVYDLEKLYNRRGKNEIEAIKRVKHIIGRTTWDKACTSLMNPKAIYHFCNETLREAFYKHEWVMNRCEKYSIFLSQGQTSIKGLHNMLIAMQHIIRKYPDAKLYIGGKDIMNVPSIKDKLLLTYYNKYIRKLIYQLKLEKSVIFTGMLDEEKMCERYLKSHVFVSASSIENSPNSLGEAMILGVPCVASDVGGVSDMLLHKEEGFVYPSDAPYMLAYYVCELFGNDTMALLISRNARKHALQTHDRAINTNRLIEIYNSILETEEI